MGICVVLSRLAICLATSLRKVTDLLTPFGGRCPGHHARMLARIGFSLLVFIRVCARRGVQENSKTIGVSYFCCEVCFSTFPVREGWPNDGNVSSGMSTEASFIPWMRATDAFGLLFTLHN